MPATRDEHGLALRSLTVVIAFLFPARPGKRRGVVVPRHKCYVLCKLRNVLSRNLRPQRVRVWATPLLSALQEVKKKDMVFKNNLVTIVKVYTF